MSEKSRKRRKFDRERVARSTRNPLSIASVGPPLMDSHHPQNSELKRHAHAGEAALLLISPQQGKSGVRVLPKQIEEFVNVRYEAFIEKLYEDAVREGLGEIEITDALTYKIASEDRASFRQALKRHCEEVGYGFSQLNESTAYVDLRKEKIGKASQKTRRRRSKEIGMSYQEFLNAMEWDQGTLGAFENDRFSAQGPTLGKILNYYRKLGYDSLIIHFSY